MKTVKYVRVSTSEQNVDRQLEKGTKTKHYIDKCSGSIVFRDRPEAGKLLSDILKQRSIEYRQKFEKDPKPIPLHKRITTVKVDSISRLGRNTIDILETVKSFTEEGICVEAEKEGIKTLIDGKENPTAKMVLSILATLSEYERELLLERQKEGIAKAQLRGAYAANGGRPAETPKDFITKDLSVRILRLLNRGLSIRNVSFKTKASIGTVQKVKKVAKELGMLDRQQPNLIINDEILFDGVDAPEGTQSKVKELTGNKGFGHW